MTEPLWWIDVALVDAVQQGFCPGSVILRATAEEAGDTKEDARQLVEARQIQPPAGHGYAAFSGPATQVEDTEEARQYLNRLLTDDERKKAARAVGLPTAD